MTKTEANVALDVVIYMTSLKLASVFVLKTEAGFRPSKRGRFLKQLVRFSSLKQRTDSDLKNEDVFCNRWFTFS